MQDKAFPCPYEGCDKAFTHKPAIRQHMVNCHIKTRPYVCQISDGSCMGTMSYNDPTNLLAHYKKRHGTKFPIHVAKLSDCIAAVENPSERAWHITVISKSALGENFDS